VINNSKLKNIYKTFFEEQNYRENVMLDNIYAYSEANNYDQAVFFIGSAHRNSLLRKVKEYQLKEKIKLNWTFYGKT
jgi:DNA-binding protein Fis